MATTDLDNLAIFWQKYEYSMSECRIQMDRGEECSAAVDPKLTTPAVLSEDNRGRVLIVNDSFSVYRSCAFAKHDPLTPQSNTTRSNSAPTHHL